MGTQTAPLLDALLNERAPGWLGGELWRLYTDQVHKWLLEFTWQSLPQRYHRLAYVEILHLMIQMYVQKLVECHNDRKRTRLTKQGVQQIQDDLLMLYNWMETHVFQNEAHEEKRLLPILVLFMQCAEENALQCFADAVQQFGIRYAYHLYDLMRLVMKYRIEDLSPRKRKAILALCSEFLKQLRAVHDTDNSLLVGENLSHGEGKGHGYMDRSIFEILCPNVGVEHCTGTRWRLEQLVDPGPVRMTVALLVNNTCERARVIKRRTMLLQTQQQTQQQASAANSDSTATDWEKGRGSYRNRWEQRLLKLIAVTLAIVAIEAIALLPYKHQRMSQE